MNNNDYRYKLEAGSKKHRCPQCEKKTFVRYIDSTTGKYLPEQYGRCDRETKCFYSLNPYQDGYSKMIWEKEQGEYSGNWQPKKIAQKPRPKIESKSYFIPFDVLKQTLQNQAFEKNTFLQNLLTNISYPFDAIDLKRVIELYYLGTIPNGYRMGAITFPFIDKNKKIRVIQVKEFDKSNHTKGTGFLHSMLIKGYQKKKQALPQWLSDYQQNDTKVSCLFGEHLLNKYELNPVGLVEAPKTAIYASLYFGFPDNPKNVLWLAVYNLSSLNVNKCKQLQGRTVYLFPDLSENGRAFELWSKRAEEMGNQLPGTKFIVSDLLEQYANDAERQNGCDLADFLIKQDWRKFRTPQQLAPMDKPSKPKPQPPQSEKGEKSEAPKTTLIKDELLQRIETVKAKELWNVEELEQYFSSIDLPNHPIQLNQGERIENLEKCIKSHLKVIKAHNGKKGYLPYFERLQKIKDLLSNIEY